MHVDVLVVGAGPTGLMLANQLVRHGVRPHVIDRHAGPTRETRALGVQARTLEIYAHLGIAQRAIELGKRATGANIWAGGKHSARLPLGDIGSELSPYPFLLILGQDDNERLLGDELRRQGMEVQWRTELVGLAQEDDHVRATLAHPDGTRRDITASWVAGCDGARSAVREMNGIAFAGAPYEHVFYVADTEITGPMVPGELNVYLWRDGFHLFFPMRGENHWRIAGILPEALRGRTDVGFDAVIPSVLVEAGGVDFKSCNWFSTYRIHHRHAVRFQQGRCFVLGDAAHIHSPVGAQGMNTGLQDAYNLAWKLALVVRKRADPRLLDSYEEERLPVAKTLLRTTDRAFMLVVSDSRLAGFLRTRIVARGAAMLMGRRWFQRFAFQGISQIGIRYRSASSSMTQQRMPRNAPQAGDRFPWMRLKLSADGPEEDVFDSLDDTRFTLIVIGQGAPAVGEHLRILEVVDDRANRAELSRMKIPWPSYYLLRPDGYVGTAGMRLHEELLRRYTTGRLHLHPASSGL